MQMRGRDLSFKRGEEVHAGIGQGGERGRGMQIRSPPGADAAVCKSGGVAWQARRSLACK